jgi:two-component system sensor histidine kinase/response regulator
MNDFKTSDFNILMVDDNPKNLQLLGSTLRNEGYQLEFATNGFTALSWIDKKQFDLILLDVMMPGMSGFEVCEEIRKKESMTDVPILFLTAKVEKESIVQGLKLGAQDYIAKPFDTAELLARVRTQLELRYSKEQLKNINQILEQKVQERTEELNLANAKLIVANEELLSLDKAKSEFLHIISHEIRTPLNGIKGSVDIIREQSNSNFEKLFYILDASVARLERFSLMALKITQLKMGRYNIDKQMFPLLLMIDSILNKLKSKVEHKSLQIEKIFEKTELQAKGDYELLSTCLHSIIDNAIKFSPSGGKITIKINIVSDAIVIEIADQGAGFSKLALNNIFKLFSPGEKHINENEGIELALSKLIIDAHSGIIEAINLPERGALVKVTLPSS